MITINRRLAASLSEMPSMKVIGTSIADRFSPLDRNQIFRRISIMLSCLEISITFTYVGDTYLRFSFCSLRSEESIVL